MTNPILSTFQIYLTENPLPSRRRQGASGKTIQGYVQDMTIFLRWWRGTFGEELTLDTLRGDPLCLNRKALQDFLSWLQATQGYQASTVLRYAASLRAFCQYLAGSEVIQHDPALGLRLPVRKIQEPKGLDDAQQSRFEATFQSPWVDKVTKRKCTNETQAGVRLIRDKAIAFLMLYAGPRVEEVEQLRLEDVKLRPKSGVLHIRQGKGFRERDVPLPQPARESLGAWLKEREKLGVSHEALFVELRAGCRPLSRRSMQSMVVEAGKRAGLDRLDPPVQVTPHVLRHTYAYMLRQAGVSTEIRAEMSGHSVATAMKYGRPKAREKGQAAELLDGFTNS
ncbi:MAG: tyrosine-type recombinase/integrase [Anaerolineales bacterium]|jgi:integrase/recombinase XerC